MKLFNFSELTFTFLDHFKVASLVLTNFRPVLMVLQGFGKIKNRMAAV